MIWMLDASAVLCWLLAEPGFERMEEILAGPDPIIIHAVNLVEVWYVVLRLGPTAWTMAQERIAAIGVTVDHTTDEAFLREAARLKAERAPIVLGDVFAVALTARLGGTLVTTDRGELTKVAAAGDCLIEFLR